MISYLTKRAIKKELIQEVECTLSPKDMQFILESLTGSRLYNDAAHFSLYKEILNIVSRKSLQLTLYYAKGVPLWLNEIPEENKSIYLKIVKQSIAGDVTRSRLISETLPCHLLKVPERYRTSYLEILYLAVKQKISIEEQIADILSERLLKAENDIASIFLNLLRLVVEKAPSLGLKVSINFILWTENVPFRVRNKFFSYLFETATIDPHVGVAEMEQLSIFMVKWDEDTTRKYHRTVTFMARMSKKVGKKVSLYLPNLIEAGHKDKIGIYKNELLQIMEEKSDLGAIAAKHLPVFLAGDDDHLLKYKTFILSVDKEKLPVAISVSQVLYQFYRMGEWRLVAPFKMLLDTLLEEHYREYSFYIKKIIESLPEWIGKVDVSHRLQYLKCLHDISKKSPKLVSAASLTLPDLLLTMDYGDITTFVEKGMRLLKESYEKASSFFSLDSETAIKKIDQKKKSVTLKEVSHELSIYATAHGGKKISIDSIEKEKKSQVGMTSIHSYTDGETIFLPDEVLKYEEKLLNYKFYKLMTAIEASKIEFGTYDFDITKFYETYSFYLDQNVIFELNMPVSEEAVDMEVFFNSFPSPKMSRDLFKIFEFGRVYHHLFQTYKGLRRSVGSIVEDAFNERPAVDGANYIEMVIEQLCQLIFFKRTKEPFFNRDIERVVSGIFLNFEEKTKKVSFNVYDAGMLTIKAYSEIMEWLFSGYDETQLEEGDEKNNNDRSEDILVETDAEYMAGTPGDRDSIETPEQIDDAPFPNTDFTKENGIQDDRFDTDENDPKAVGNKMDSILEQQNYNPIENISFIGDLRADKVHEKKVELVQVFNNMKKILEETNDENLKKEINDLLTRQETDLPIIHTDEILPLVKGENLERLLEGYREKEINLEDVIDNRVSGGDKGSVLTGENTYYYDEWDSVIGDYKPKWATVHEIHPSAGNSEIVMDILYQNANIIDEVKYRFEQMKVKGLTKVKRQYEGDNFDIEALMEAIVDIKAKNSPSDRLYIKRHRQQREVSALFLVDLSNSTSKKIEEIEKTILDVERESLVIMSEALEKIGDNYAIYGFSGRGRHHCEFYVFKDFSQSFDDRVKNKIGWMKPLTSTRLGPALRHSMSKLTKEESKSKLLFLITDGRPVDNDNYDDRYARDDVKMALKEAKNLNIHPFCITINEDSKDYYDDVYGDINYTVIKDVSTLPNQLPKIYCKMTL